MNISFEQAFRTEGAEVKAGTAVLQAPNIPLEHLHIGEQVVLQKKGLCTLKMCISAKILHQCTISQTGI